MSPTPALRFAETARRLGDSARGVGLAVPAFRCPPRVPGAARTDHLPESLSGRTYYVASGNREETVDGDRDG